MLLYTNPTSSFTTHIAQQHCANTLHKSWQQQWYFYGLLSMWSAVQADAPSKRFCDINTMTSITDENKTVQYRDMSEAWHKPAKDRIN